jgi:hypothetical protein
MTYEEAVNLANWKLAKDYANKVQDQMVRQSLRKR